MNTSPNIGGQHTAVFAEESRPSEILLLAEVQSMTPERLLARFIRTTHISETPPGIATTAKQVVMTVAGTSLAGAQEDGIKQLRSVLVRRGGRPEATSWVFGDRLPAASAALLNGAMARALDYCDAMQPGLHLGSSVVPTALAASEFVGGVSGSEFMSAVVVGLETGSRLNLGEAQYDGFDPTGVAGILGATAAAARISGLTEDQTLHALALAFNRCGGSFQSNIDGSLAVRLIQGWVAQMAIECVELAGAGLTGPENFLTGTYGYAKLFGRGQVTADAFVADLGSSYKLTALVFKKYPSCGVTQAVTELALSALAIPGFETAGIEDVRIQLPPYAFRLVGHPFEIGDTPRVDAQFSARYCVANALLRGSSRLEHFRSEAVIDPFLAPLIDKIGVTQAIELDDVGHTAARMVINRSGHAPVSLAIEIAPGFPGNALSPEEHLQRFRDCLAYSTRDPSQEQGDSLAEAIEKLEDYPNVQVLVTLLVRIAD